MAQQRQILNWMSDFTSEAARLLDSMTALSSNIAYYDAIGLPDDTIFTDEMLAGSEFEGLDSDDIQAAVETVRFVLESLIEFGVFASVAPILPAPVAGGQR